LALRIEGEQDGRVNRSGSSLILPRASIRSITSLASLLSLMKVTFCWVKKQHLSGQIPLFSGAGKAACRLNQLPR
jgi:hypothetical protein